MSLNNQDLAFKLDPSDPAVDIDGLPPFVPFQPMDKAAAIELAESIGKHLGLDDESWAKIHRSKEESDKAVVFMDSIAGDGTPSLLHPAVAAQFASRYLPAFMRSIMSRTCDNKLAIMYTQIFLTLLPIPSFNHYLRQHPEARGLFPSLLCDLARRPFLILKDEPTTNSPCELFRGAKVFTEPYYERYLFHARLIIIAHIMAHLSSPKMSAIHSSHLFSPTRLMSLSKVLSWLQPIVKEYHEIRREWSNSIGTHFLIIHTALRENFSGRITPVASMLRDAHDRGGHAVFLDWFFCVECPITSVASIKEHPVENLLKCGKCMAMSYCSVEHQLLHFKTHKQVCLRPTW